MKLITNIQGWETISNGWCVNRFLAAYAKELRVFPMSIESENVYSFIDFIIIPLRLFPPLNHIFEALMHCGSHMVCIIVCLDFFSSLLRNGKTMAK